jgi:predicted O-methyltransferase YrrM
MQIQKISSQTQELIATLNPIYNSFSEMTPSEQEFLTDIVRQYKPKKLLELGVASGSSSVLLLNAIKDSPDSHLTSIDYSIPYYRDKTKNSGFVVDEYPQLKPKWTLYTGGVAAKFMDNIGENIDFCFIDTMHALPGEVIDFLLVLPYLKPEAVVVFHDTNLQTWGNWPQCTSNNMLVSAISGEKVVPETFENVFFHNTLKTDFQMYFPNITGIILDGTQQDKIWDIFNLLTQKWKYALKSEDVSFIKASLKKHYSEFYVKMFDNILNYQMNIAKNDRTIQDLIKEHKELVDKGLQEETKTLQTFSEKQSELILRNIETTASKTDITISGESIQQKIEQYIKEQNDSCTSLSKQNFSTLKSNLDAISAAISNKITETNSLLLNKGQQLDEAFKQTLSLQQENCSQVYSNIQSLENSLMMLHQELNDNGALSHQNVEMLSQKLMTNQQAVDRLENSLMMLHQELNNNSALSHQNVEMLSQKLTNNQQDIDCKYSELSRMLMELKMYASSSVIKKRYWYYKLMRWYPTSAKRKKYTEKYNDVKQLYKSIRKLKDDF